MKHDILIDDVLKVSVTLSWRHNEVILLGITKTYLYNFDPLKPYFIVKLGLIGVYITCLIFAQKHRLWVLVRTASPTIYVLSRLKNIDCGYLLEPPRTQSMFWAEIWKYQEYFCLFFLSKNFQILEVKFSVYLNRCVFVMVWRPDYSSDVIGGK